MHLGPGSGLLQGTATSLWMSPLPGNWTGKANTKGESAELLYQSRLYSLTTIDFSRTAVIYFLLPFPSHPHLTCTTTKQASRTCYLSESPVQDLAISSTLLLSCWAQTSTWILLTKLNSSMQNNRARRNSSNLSPQQTNKPTLHLFLLGSWQIQRVTKMGTICLLTDYECHMWHCFRRRKMFIQTVRDG